MEAIALEIRRRPFDLEKNLYSVPLAEGRNGAWNVDV